MRLVIICLAVSILAPGCQGKDRSVGGDTSGRALRGSSVESDTASNDVEPSPDGNGEMLPKILPDKIVSGDAGDGDTLKTDRKNLVAAAWKAFGKGELDEAAAIVDTLLLLHPDDPEALEIRARALTARGQNEQGLSDLKRCCELGRSSCCSTVSKEKSKQGR